MGAEMGRNHQELLETRAKSLEVQARHENARNRSKSWFKGSKRGLSRRNLMGLVVAGAVR